MLSDTTLEFSYLSLTEGIYRSAQCVQHAACNFWLKETTAYYLLI